MKLGLTLGYWMAQPPTDALDRILEAERLGYDTVFTAESWGTDAFSPLAWWGSQTSRIRLGTSIVQISARTPDVVRDARAHARPPQRAAGSSSGSACPARRWSRAGTAARSASRWPAPASTSTSIRQVLRREAPVTNAGPHYPLPYDGPGSLGLGKPLQARSPTRCGPTSRSGSAPRARRTWR